MKARLTPTSQLKGSLTGQSQLQGSMSNEINIVEEATDYNILQNKPQINRVVLIGDTSLEELGIQPAENALSNIEIEQIIQNIML